MGSRRSNPSVKPGQKNPIDSNTIRSSSLRDYTHRLDRHLPVRPCGVRLRCLRWFRCLWSLGRRPVLEDGTSREPVPLLALGYAIPPRPHLVLIFEQRVEIGPDALVHRAAVAIGEAVLHQGAGEAALVSGAVVGRPQKLDGLSDGEDAVDGVE